MLKDSTWKIATSSSCKKLAETPNRHTARFIATIVSGPSTLTKSIFF